MRQVIVATSRPQLLQELEALAQLHHATVVHPHNFTDLLFTDAVIMVIDPYCLAGDSWRMYQDFLQVLGEEHSLPLVVLMQREQPLPDDFNEAIVCQKGATLFQCYEDDTARVMALVEEALEKS
jgi:hypothetical protein